MRNLGKIFVVLCLIPALANALEFFSGSPLIEQYKLEVVPAQVNDGKIYFSSDALSITSQPVYFIGSGASVELHGISKNDSVNTKGCIIRLAEDPDAYVADINAPDGFYMVAIGAGGGEHLKFTRSELSSCPKNNIPQNVKNKDGDLNKTSLQCYSLSGLPYTAYYAEWEGGKTETCEGYAMNQSGYINTSNRFIPWESLMLDCNGEVKNPEDFPPKTGRLLGSLLVDNGAESWLIFTSQGQSSWGFSTMQVNSLKSPRMMQHNVVHNWGGCEKD